ncbi:hypothetical protein Hanom_Chr15g01337461 [Helianthus anomalus]
MSESQAVKAVDQEKWTQGEHDYFWDKCMELGLDPDYCVEDVEEDESGSAKFISQLAKAVVLLVFGCYFILNFGSGLSRWSVYSEEVKRYVLGTNFWVSGGWNKAEFFAGGVFISRYSRCLGSSLPSYEEAVGSNLMCHDHNFWKHRVSPGYTMWPTDFGQFFGWVFITLCAHWVYFSWVWSDFWHKKISTVGRILMGVNHVFWKRPRKYAYLSTCILVVKPRLIRYSIAHITGPNKCTSGLCSKPTWDALRNLFRGDVGPHNSSTGLVLSALLVALFLDQNKHIGAGHIFYIDISYGAWACDVMIPFGRPTSGCFKWWTEGPAPMGLEVGWNGALVYKAQFGRSMSFGGFYLVHSRVRRPKCGYFDLFVVGLCRLARKDINPTLIVIYFLSRVYMVSLVMP